MSNKLIGIIKILLSVFKDNAKEQNKVIESEKKGKHEEQQIGRILKELNVKYLMNVYVPTFYGTTEIDLILFDKTGIYVIESKNYSCKVIGKEEDKEWTTLYPNGSNYSLYNPIKQNNSHIKALLEYCNDITVRQIKSFIVFSNSADISEVKKQNNKLVICNESELSKLLKEQLKGNTIVSERKIMEIYQKLKKHTNVSKRVQKKHIQQIKKYKERNE